MQDLVVSSPMREGTCGAWATGLALAIAVLAASCAGTPLRRTGEGFHHRRHFLFNFRKILRRDTVLQIDIVIEAIFNRGAVSELRIRPQSGNGSCHHMSTGVPQSVDIRHLLSFFQSFSIAGFGHGL